MVYSMTGYGRSELQTDEYLINVDFKSVNHRYFDFNCKCPRQFNFIQDKIKTLTNKYISRGKIECSVSVTILQSDNAEVLIDENIAKAYIEAFNTIADKFSIQNDICTSNIIKMPEVINLKKGEIDEDELGSLILDVSQEALNQFNEMRKIEGTRLCTDVLEKANNVLNYVEFIEKRSPEVVEEYNIKLRQRIKDLIDGYEVDDARILQEAAIFADKTAVDEETVRLRSHIKQFCTLCENNDNAVGKKMDFIIQEINRETNTIGSKVSDYEMTSVVLNMKSEIEKIREQIQNIE